MTATLTHEPLAVEMLISDDARREREPVKISTPWGDQSVSVVSVDPDGSCVGLVMDHAPFEIDSGEDYGRRRIAFAHSDIIQPLGDVSQ